MTQKVEIGDGVSVTLIFDGTSKRTPGNFQGVHYVPPQGSISWWAVNGDCGDDCPSEEEAIVEIKRSWGRG